MELMECPNCESTDTHVETNELGEDVGVCNNCGRIEDVASWNKAHHLKSLIVFFRDAVRDNCEDDELREWFMSLSDREILSSLEELVRVAQRAIEAGTTMINEALAPRGENEETRA